MKQNKILFLIVSLLLISLASASTQIIVKTIPFGEINLNIRESGTIDVIERFKETATQYGDAVFTYSGSLPYFDMTYFIKKNDEKVVNGIIEDQEGGGEIYLELIPEGFEILYAPESTPKIEVNETAEETEEVVEEETTLEENKTEHKKKLTSFSVFKREDGSTNWNFFYYFGGAIVLALIIFFLLKNRKAVPRNIKIRKLSELKSEKKEEIEKQEKIIEEAEGTIAKAKRKIKEIKNGGKDKISELQRRLKEDEEELRKLEKMEESHREKDDYDGD